LLERGSLPVIPNNSTRKRYHPFDRDLYHGRNHIKLTIRRLEDFHRVSTLYDKLARTISPLSTSRDHRILVMSPDPEPADKHRANVPLASHPEVWVAQGKDVEEIWGFLLLAPGSPPQKHVRLKHRTQKWICTLVPNPMLTPSMRALSCAESRVPFFCMVLYAFQCGAGRKPAPTCQRCDKHRCCGWSDLAGAVSADVGT
jgi:hypothetical protein